MPESYKKRDTEDIVEEQTLVRESNGTRIVPKGTESVRLSSGWRKNTKSDDETKDGSLDQAEFESEPPHDRKSILWFFMILHGIGVLLPWNVYLNSLDYFGVKLNQVIDKNDLTTWIIFSGQIPNFVFSWLNVFCQIGGNISVRIIWGLVIQAVVLIFSIVMAMNDTSSFQNIFFYITIGSIIILNIANGFYQNSVYGLAAKLPGKYTGAIILGSNLCGLFTTIVSILTSWMNKNNGNEIEKQSTVEKNYDTAAIYYFIAALFVVLICFDSFFALSLNRYYRHYEILNAKQQKKNEAVNSSTKVPYLAVIKQCWVQLLNVYLLFSVTLFLFPTILGFISNPDSSISADNYANWFCFFTFNVTALLGSLLASFYQWPNPKWLIVPISLRILFIPAFMLFCNYQYGASRLIPILYHNDILYLVLSIAMGLSSGYFSSVAMVYCSKVVESRYASTAGMLAGAALSSGIISGIIFGTIGAKIMLKKF